MHVLWAVMMAADGFAEIDEARRGGPTVAGEVRNNRPSTDPQIRTQAVVECCAHGPAEDDRRLRKAVPRPPG